MADRKPTSIVQLKIRMRESLRSQIEDAAELHGVSLNAEAVDRLERSVGAEDAFDTMVGGPEVAGILEVIARLMKETGQSAGFVSTFTLEGANQWFNNPYAYDQVVQGVNRVLEEFRPAGKIKAPKAPPKTGGPFDEINVHEHIGIMTANTVIGDARDPEESPTAAGAQWGRRVNRKLGTAVANLRKAKK